MTRSPRTDHSDILARRDWLARASTGVLGASLSGWLPRLADGVLAAEGDVRRRRKSCILLWMDGGPSQVHTFSLHEKDPEYAAIETAVPGIRISEHLPLLAQSMGDLALLRTMSTGQNNHAPGQYLMHMGRRASVAVDYPSLGAIAARENRLDRSGGLPAFVVVGQSTVPAKFHRSGALGADFAPMMLGGSSIENIRPPVPSRSDARLALLEANQQAEIDRFGSDLLRSHAASYRKAVDLMRTSDLKVFDVKSEPAAVHERYGTGGFGQQCLLARRLVEAGVSFVEVAWGGWDHHGGAAAPVKQRSPELDRGFSALISDLKERGLLETTLVVWMGEFGRGPAPSVGGGINTRIGSGHFAKCWTTVLAGAGLKTGRAVGRPTPDACDVQDRPVSTGEFFATLCKALDIDPATTYEAAGRPVPYVATGSEPLSELFG